MSIGPLLKRSIKSETSKKTAPNWRINQRHFVRKSAQHICEPGAINISSGWFGQGHVVSKKHNGMTNSNTKALQADRYPLLPSLNLRTQLYLGSPKFLKKSNKLERFLNITLSLIHPEQFQCGLSMLRKLRQLETTRDLAVQWQSVYNGISIISNRQTPSHRDTKGRIEWYDTLVSYSNGAAKPSLSIKDIGMNLEYSSGTVIGFCGSVLEHEVKSWGIGDRVCYAHFMRESVRERLDVPPAGWAKRKMYRNRNKM